MQDEGRRKEENEAQQDAEHGSLGPSNLGYPEDETEHFIRVIREWFSARLSEASLVEVVTSITTIVLVVVGIIGASIYYGQLVEMRQATIATKNAVDVARNTLTQSQMSFRQEQRPWVSFKGVDATSDPFGILVNSGKTPAREVDLWIGILLVDPNYVLTREDETLMKSIVSWVKNNPTHDADRTIFTSTRQSSQNGLTFIYAPSLAPARFSHGHINVPMHQSLGTIAPESQTVGFSIGPRIGPEDRRSLVVYGEVDYVDFTGSQHFTNFCKIRKDINSNSSFSACPIYGNMQ